MKAGPVAAASTGERRFPLLPGRSGCGAPPTHPQRCSRRLRAVPPGARRCAHACGCTGAVSSADPALTAALAEPSGPGRSAAARGGWPAPPGPCPGRGAAPAPRARWIRAGSCGRPRGSPFVRARGRGGALRGAARSRGTARGARPRGRRCGRKQRWRGRGAAAVRGNAGLPRCEGAPRGRRTGRREPPPAREVPRVKHPGYCRNIAFP